MEKPTDENTKPLDLEVGPSKHSMEEEGMWVSTCPVNHN